MSNTSYNAVSSKRRVLLTVGTAKEGSPFAKVLEDLGCQVYMSSPTRVEELEQLLDLLGPTVLVMTDPFESDFLSTFRRIKTPPHRALLPVVVAAEVQDRHVLLRSGVEAVLDHPTTSGDLAAAVAGILERVAILNQHKEIDDLTGAYTAAAALERLDHEVARARRYRRQGCVSLIDLDNYERVREGVGELSADAGLRRFAQILRSELRETDLIGRVGEGDRFMVMMPDTDLAGAVQAMRRVLAVIGCANVDVPGGQRVTLAASAGAGSFGTDSPDAILARVGTAIDEAKDSGGGTLFTA